MNDVIELIIFGMLQDNHTVQKMYLEVLLGKVMTPL
jgi:hypothetical protein